MGQSFRTGARLGRRDSASGAPRRGGGARSDLNLYPSGARLRDAGQLRLLNRFLAEVRAAWRIDLEVSVSDDPRDQRAFDAVLRGPGQTVAVEAHSRLVDFQAQARVARLKLAASDIERLVIVLNATRANRQALIQAGPVLRDASHSAHAPPCMPFAAVRTWLEMGSC